MKKSNRVVLVTLMLLAFVLMFAACGTVQQQTETNRVTVGQLNFSVAGNEIADSLASNENFSNGITELETYDDNEIVNVIITMGKGSLVENFLKSGDYATVADYVVSDEGIRATEAMTAQYESIVATMKAGGIEFEAGKMLFSLVNGFSVSMKYSEYKKLADLEGIDSYSIATQYSVPKTVDQSVYAFAENNGLLTNDTGYNGEGMVVAIIDSAFDIDHEAFKNMPENPALDLADLEALWKSNAFTAGKSWGAMGIYKNAKVPFAYDYADNDNDVICRYTNAYRYGYGLEHGTHVAGIVLGKSETIQGAAYNAQLVGMKVATDRQGAIYLDNIIAALGDAILLGVDAINISIGSTSGGEDMANPYYDYMNKAYELAERCGVSVTAAAGNDYNAGEGINGSLVENPDNGLIGMPSSYTTVNTAASINGYATQYITVNGQDLTFSNSAKMDLKPNDFYDILGDQEKADFEYVIVPNFGTQSDFAMVDVKGKIAVTQRGNNSLADKMVQAANAGAVGCIIINYDETNIIAVIGEAKIPTICVRLSVGNILRTAPQKVITIDSANSFIEMSTFSSWGPTTSLDIGIDMTAPGGNVYSSLPKAYTDIQGFSSAYGFMSGTSMASPNVTAAVVAVKQYLKETRPELTSVEAQTLAYQLLMSTASIAEDTDGNPYSPRKQGAGVIDIEAAINAAAYLSVTGSDKTKLNLGTDAEKEGIYTLRFNVVNMGDKALSYKVGAMVFTETVHQASLPSILNRVGTKTLMSVGLKNKIANKAYMLEGADIAIRAKNAEVDGDVVTVAAGEKAVLSVVITLTEENKAYMDANFPNGIYVEGFATLEALEGSGSDLSIPYISFYGDWYNLPMFEPYASDVINSGVASFQGRTTRLMQFYDGKSGMSLGLDMGGFYEMHHVAPGYAVPTLDPDKGAIGVNPEVTPYILEIALLRHAECVELNVMDSVSGSIFQSGQLYNITKTYYKYGMGQLGYDVCVQLAMPGFTPSNYNLANNSTVNYTLRAYFDYDKGVYQEMVMPVFVDLEAPTLNMAEVKEENGRYILYMDVYDNHYMMDYTFYVEGDNGLRQMINGYVPVTTNVKNGNNKLSFDITNYMDKIGDGNLYVEFFDYARNTVRYELEINSNNDAAEGNVANVDTEQYLDVQTLSFTYTTNEVELASVRDEKFELNTRGIEPMVVPTAQGEHQFWVDGNGNLTGYSGPGGEVTLPDNVININSYVFYYNTTIDTLILNEGIKRISNYAMYMCGIRKVVASSTLETINPYAVTGAYNLEYFDLSKATALKTIGDQAFACCTSLKEIVIAEGANVTLGNWTYFGVTGLEKLVVNGTLTLKNSLIITPNLKTIEINGTLDFDPNQYQAAMDLVSVENVETIIFRGNQKRIGFTNQYNYFSWGLSDMPKLKEVIFEGDVESIDGLSFSNCLSLEKVQFNGNVGSIGEHAFSQCPNLKTFTVGENNEYLTYDAETMVVYDNAKTKMFIAPSWGFEGNFVVPETVKTLSKAQFGVGEACGNRPIAYSSFASPASGTSIRYLLATSPATGESLVKGIKLHSGIREIPKSCFKDCVNLDENGLDWNGAVITYMGSYALRNTGFKNFVFPSTLVKVDNYVMDNCKKLETVQMPSRRPSSTAVYAFKFENCTALKEMSIPSWMANPVMGMFKGCTSLEKVHFEGYFTGVSAEAFSNCTSLKEVTATNYQPSQIGQLAFHNTGLESFTFAAGTYNIYLEAFRDSKQLKTIVIPQNSLLQTVGQYAFEGCSALEEFYIGYNAKTIDITAFEGCSSLRGFTLDSRNKNFAVVDGVLFDKSMTTLVAYPGGKEATEYTLPGTVTEISMGQFDYTTNLKVLNLPSVKTIDTQSFQFSSVEEINAPVLERIEAGAFNNAENLKTMDLSNVSYIGYMAFWNAALEEVTLGANLEFLGYAAFKNCKINNVVIAEGVSADFDLAGSFYQSGWANVELEGSNYVMFEDGLYNADKTILFKYFGSAEQVKLPEGLIKISHEAFKGNTAVKSVVMPKTLEVIGDQAFYGCTALETLEFLGEKAPLLQSYYTGARYPYNQFVKAIDELNGEALNINFIHPNNDSYNTPVWKLYFGE